MEKIFIALDSQIKNHYEENLNLLSGALKEVNEVIYDLIGEKLDSETALNLITKGKGLTHYVDEQVKREELKLKAAKFAKHTINNICSDLREALTNDLTEALAGISTFDPNTFFKFLGFHKNGNPYILETAQKEISDLCSIYATTLEQIEFYKKHKAAVKTLNELMALSTPLFAGRIHSMNFFASLFEFKGRMDQIHQKEINYNLAK
jgi:hypothetical protein